MVNGLMNEEQFLQDVLNKIGTAINKLEEKLQIGSDSIGEMQEYFWDSFSEFDEYGYEYSMSQQAMEMEAGSLANLKKKHRQYVKMMDSPYFGRIDFTYEGENAPETYYIGLGSFTPDKSYMPLIYDWRAPVSSLFYDYDAGPASYTAPAGEIRGVIEKKFQYKIKRGKLIYALESNLKIDDEILQNELSSNADATLKSIVTTIQKEQNQIIRNDKDHILIVQGSAGSGKTSIALHRIAYLLYHHRNSMKANQILILSPNEVFADYISHILPELGEENILETTMDLLAYKELKHIADTESRYEYLERLFTLSEKEAQKVKDRLDEKNGQNFVQDMYSYVLMLEDDLMELTEFSYGKTFWNLEQMRKLFYEKFSRIPLLKRMDAIAEYIVDANDTLQDKGSARAAQDYDMYEDRESFEFNDNNASDGNKYIVSDSAYARKKLRQMYRVSNLLDIYNDFLVQEGMKPLKADIKYLDYEDVYPMMYLKFLLEGTGKYRVMKHLVIDEMQDYTFMQYSILQMMFDCPMTILGDKEQTMEQNADSLLTFLPQIFGKKAKVMVLDKSYRSTTQIAAFAAKLADLKDVSCFLRNGEEVKADIFSNEEDMIRTVLTNIKAQIQNDTHAVLCKNAKDAEHVYQMILENKLADDECSVNLLTSESEHFGKGIAIMPFYLAKGLEFDNVHVVYADNKHYAGERYVKMLYIMATRALHTLQFYGVGDIADCIRHALNNLDEHSQAGQDLRQ